MEGGWSLGWKAQGGRPRAQHGWAQPWDVYGSVSKPQPTGQPRPLIARCLWLLLCQASQGE